MTAPVKRIALVLCLAGIACILPARNTSAATASLVQSGTVANAANGIQTVTISGVDPATSFLIFQTRHGLNRPVGSEVRGRIPIACANPCTTIEFERVTNEAPVSTIDIQWYVVSFESGVRVQRGETTQDALSKNVTLPLTLAAVNQAFVTWSKTPTNTDTTWDGNDYVLGEITSTTNVQFRTSGIAATHIISWQVVEFTDAVDVDVQKGSINPGMTTAQTSVTATLTTAVDVNKTFVLVGLRSGGSAGANVGAMLLRAQLTDSTTITIDRSTVGAPAVQIDEIVWQAIELKDRSTVWRGSTFLPAADALEFVPLVPYINPSRAIAFGSVQGGGGQNMGRSPYVGDDILGVASVTMALSSTQLTLDRTNTAAAADVGWFVVEFDQGDAKVLSGSYIGNGVDNRTIDVGFVPDFVVVKGNTTEIGVFRTSTMSGDNAKNSTGATALAANLIQSFTSAGVGGFTVGTDAQVNAAGVQYSWTAFRAGPGKMAVGSYTGTGAASPPPVTGLGFSPELVYIMSAGAHEAVNRSSAGGTFDFETSADLVSISTLDADGFTVANQTRVNAAGTTYHWVAWNEAAGYLDVGTYTGNGAASQDITTVGFEPEFLFVKKDEPGFFAYQRSASLASSNVDLSGVFDNFAPVAGRLTALLSNGFRVGNSVNVNETGDTFLYHAWKRQSEPLIITGDYDGNGGTQSITQVGFQPDVVIVKTSTQIAVIRTSTMGNGKPMTGATGLTANTITSLDASGFSVGTNAMANSNGLLYYFIAFKAGPSTMKVGTYTGTGAANAITGVGFSPELVFIMRDGASEAIHQSIVSAEAHNFLNSFGTVGLFASSDADGFTVTSTDARVNQSGQTYHYIAWNEIPGFMDVGTYDGSGLDGLNIGGVGFEPEYVIVKHIDNQEAVHHPGSLGRGVDSSLFFANIANAGDRIQALQPDGFQVGAAFDVNLGGTANYFYYAWKRPFVSALTAVTLTSFTATRYDRGVLAEWRTGYEIDNLGFHVYREIGGIRTRVTGSLVAGSGLMAGQGTAVNGEQRYAYWDLDSLSADPSAVYWLEDVDFNGTSTWHGPVTPVAGGLPAPEVPASEALGERFGRGGNAKRRGTVFLTQTERVQRASTDGWGAPAARAEMQWSLAAGAAVKIGVDRPGWYRVGQPELVAAGLDPGVDPRVLQLFIEGAEQALSVVGGADGSFDPADAIEFYGTGADTPFTDTRVYWLTAGSRPGLRVALRGRPGRGARTVQAGSFRLTLQQKERSIYFAALRNGDDENWFGSLVSEDPIEVTFDVSNLDPAGAASLEVSLQGVSSSSDPAPNHRVAVQVNGTDVGELEFDDQAKEARAFAIPAGLLLEGANVVTMVALGGEADFSLIDVMRLGYAHTYRADADLLRFTAAGACEVTVGGTVTARTVADPSGLTADGSCPVTVGGFATAAIRVVDITDPRAAEEIRGAVGPDGGLWMVTVPVPAGASRTLLAFTGETVASPAFVRANHPSSWHAETNAAEYVAISHGQFADRLDPLVARRVEQGLSTARIDVEDLYDEFSFGEKKPQALKDFVRRALAGWTRAPRFLLLVGDATIDPRDYAGFGDADFVPTKHVALANVALETASDDWFADLDDDGLAEVAVGRLSVRTGAQAERMVAKILDYETAGARPWNADVLLVADQNGAEDDFEQSSRVLESLVPPGYGVRQIFSGAAGPAVARQELIDAVNQGQLIVNFVGHGSVSVWGQDGTLLTAADVNAEWRNGDRLPLVVTMNCLNGFFHGIYDEESLAETMLRAPQGGAVAAWSSSGLTESAMQARVNQELFRLLFSQPGLTVGEAVAAAKGIVSDRDLRRSWIFFGDPALRLHRPASASLTEPPGLQGRSVPDGQPAAEAEPVADADGAAAGRDADPVQLADFNADGRADLLLYEAHTGRWSLRLVSEREGFRVTEGTWLAGAQAFAARLDANPLVDVFLYEAASGQWMQALNNGDGTFRTESGAWDPGWRVWVANFVGDSRDEVFLYRPITGAWCLSDGAPGFAFRSCGALGAGDLSVADFTGDALADLFLADRAAGTGWVAVNDGSGGFSIDAGQWPYAWGARATSLARGGAAMVDLILYDPTSGTWAERLPQEGFALRDGLAAALALLGVDLSGDGADDLVLYDPRAGSWSVLMNSAGGLRVSTGGVWRPGLTLAAGDLDGDGRPDLLLNDAGTRTSTACTARSSGSFRCGRPSAWDPSWAPVGFRR